MPVKRYLLLALVFSVMLTIGPVYADSEFYVIAGGGGVGTRIASLPYTISTPGFYYLSNDLDTSGAGIIVNADNVTIDLMGFCLKYTGITGATGIDMNGRANVEIRNGTVSSFIYGIRESNTSTGAKHRVINVRAIHNSYGIWLSGENHLVNGCTGSNGFMGIYVFNGTISNSVACNNSDTGIYLEWAGSAIGNIAAKNTTYGFRFGLGPRVVDRNNASENGTGYFGGGGSTVWGLNGG
jgi:hypothetical protein